MKFSKGLKGSPNCVVEKKMNLRVADMPAVPVTLQQMRFAFVLLQNA